MALKTEKFSAALERVQEAVEEIKKPENGEGTEYACALISLGMLWGDVELMAGRVAELEAEVEKLKAQICALKFEREMGGRRA